MTSYYRTARAFDSSQETHTPGNDYLHSECMQLSETNKKISSLQQTDDPERSSYKSGASLFRSVERSRARCNCLIQNCFHECSQMLFLTYYAVSSTASALLEKCQLVLDSELPVLTFNPLSLIEQQREES